MCKGNQVELRTIISYTRNGGVRMCETEVCVYSKRSNSRIRTGPIPEFALAPYTGTYRVYERAFEGPHSVRDGFETIDRLFVQLETRSERLLTRSATTQTTLMNRLIRNTASPVLQDSSWRRSVEHGQNSDVPRQARRARARRRRPVTGVSLSVVISLPHVAAARQGPGRGLTRLPFDSGLQRTFQNRHRRIN